MVVVCLCGADVGDLASLKTVDTTSTTTGKMFLREPKNVLKVSLRIYYVCFCLNTTTLPGTNPYI